MLNLEQIDIAKQTPMGLFGLSMIVLGCLINKYPGGNESVGSLDCDKALSSTDAFNNATDGILPHYISSGMAFILPLLPLLVPPHNNRKLELVAAHLVGQTGSFGSSEVARHYIISPEVYFYSKCNLTQEDCSGVANITTINDACINSRLSINGIFDSLHGSPHVPSVMIGAALFAFFISVKHWRHNTTTTPSKYYIKSFLCLVCLVIMTVIVINCYLQTNHSPLQILSSVVYGLFLQAIVYVFFKHSKPSPNDILLNPIVISNKQ